MGSYSFRKIFLFASLLTLLSVWTAYAEKVHRVTEDDTLEKVETQYEALDSLNPQYPSKKAISEKFKPKKEFVVDPALKLITCTHTVQKGEWLASVVRRYSYRHPFSLGLIEKLRGLNQHIEDIDSVNVGDRVLVPLFVSKQVRVKDGDSCQVLIAANELDVLGGQKGRMQSQVADQPNGLTHRGGTSVVNGDEKSNLLFIGAGPIYNTILGEEKDSQVEGAIISEVSPAFVISLQRKFVENWSVLLKYTRLQNVYRVETEDSADIENKEVATNHLDLSVVRDLDRETSVSLRVGFSEAVFYKRLSATVVEMGTDQIMNLHLQFQRMFLSLADFDFSASLGGRYLLPFGDGTFGLKSGFGYNLGLQVQRELGHGQLISTLTYRRQFSESRDLDLEKNWVQALVGYQFLF